MDLYSAQWRKSSRSASESNCVEVTATAGRVAARDSKDPDGPKLAFAHTDWSAFTRYVKGGAFDAS